MNAHIKSIKNWLTSDQAKTMGKDVVVHAVLGLTTAVIINVTYSGLKLIAEKAVDAINRES